MSPHRLSQIKWYNTHSFVYGQGNASFQFNWIIKCIKCWHYNIFMHCNTALLDLMHLGDEARICQEPVGDFAVRLQCDCSSLRDLWVSGHRGFRGRHHKLKRLLVRGIISCYFRETPCYEQRAQLLVNAAPSRQRNVLKQ